MDLLQAFIFQTIYAAFFILFLEAIGLNLTKISGLKEVETSPILALGFLFLFLSVPALFQAAYYVKYSIILIYIIFSVYILFNIECLKYKSKFYDILFTTFFVSLLYYIVSNGNKISLFAVNGDVNGDFFNWYSVAGHLEGSGNYFNNSPGAESTFVGSNLIIDGLGTDWFLIFAGFGSRFLIQSASAAIVILATWMALTIQDQIRQFIKLNRLYLILLSSALVVTPLYLYISFNGFFAHILGLISLSTLIVVIIKFQLNDNYSLFYKISLYVISTAFMLVVYQSGFIILQMIAMGLAIFMCLTNLLKIKNPQKIKESLSTIILPYSCALTICAIFLNKYTFYTVNRLKTVASADIAWPLIPKIPKIFQDLFPALNHVHAALIFYVPLSMVILILLLKMVDKGVQETIHKGALLGGIIWVYILLTLYFIWLYLGFSPYQNWKFASFFLYPLGFLFIVPILLSLQISIKASKIYKMWVLSVVPIILLFLQINYIIGFRTNLLNYDKYAGELIILKKYIPSDVPLILDLPPYAHTMLAMQILSKSNKLYPIAASYVPASPKEVIDSLKNPLILQEKGDCYYNLSEKNIYDSAIFSLGYKNNFNDSNDTFLKYKFSSLCIPTWIKFEKGVSGRESWGRWTDGKEAIFRIQLPRNMLNENIVLRLNVAPFLHSEATSQKLNVNINDQAIDSFIISSPQTIEINIPRTLIKTRDLFIGLEIPGAVSPSINGTGDTRVLGIALHQINLTKR